MSTTAPHAGTTGVPPAWSLSVPSSRAGYLPIPLQYISPKVLVRIPFYLRVRPAAEEDPHEGERYALYTGGVVSFGEADWQRLCDNGIRFIYIRTADQPRLQRHLESLLAAVAADPDVPTSEASALIYDTSFELVNELLSDPNLHLAAGPLRDVCLGISTFVIRQPEAFSYLFAAARHDYYLATHLVNVATLMVTLAYQLGHRNEADLTAIGQAGLLHDLGKLRIPSMIMTKKGNLTEAEREQVRAHAAHGYELVKATGRCPEVVATVALQHHERLDGSGYPQQLATDAIDPVSRICAVADAFDAMTALRPYKDRALTVPEAMAILQSEAPARYDPKVVQAWRGLIDPIIEESGGEDEDDDERREHPRHAFCCRTWIQVLRPGGERRQTESSFAAKACSLSRGGIGLRSPCPLAVGQRIRVHLRICAPARTVLDGTVVRCQALSEGLYDLGVQFAASTAALTDLRASADDR